LYFCKYILTNDIQFLYKTIEYNLIAQSFLSQQSIPIKDDSYRNFTSCECSGDCKKILSARTITGEPVAFKSKIGVILKITSKSSNFIIWLPGIFKYYVSENTKINYFDEISGEEVEQEILYDEQSNYEFIKSPANYFLENLNNISNSNKSYYYDELFFRKNKYSEYKKINSTSLFIEEFSKLKFTNSLENFLKISFNTTLEAICIYGFINTFQEIACMYNYSTTSKEWDEILSILIQICINIYRKRKVNKGIANVDSDTFDNFNVEFEKLYNVSSSQFEEIIEYHLLIIKFKELLESNFSSDIIKNTFLDLLDN